MSNSKSDIGIVNPELQDAQRRRSLKFIGAGIAAPLGVLSGASLAVAADEVLQPRSKKELDTKSATHAHDIELHLYSSRNVCLLYTSPSPRDKRQTRMPSSA